MLLNIPNHDTSTAVPPEVFSLFQTCSDPNAPVSDQTGFYFNQIQSCWFSSWNVKQQTFCSDFHCLFFRLFEGLSKFFFRLSLLFSLIHGIFHQFVSLISFWFMTQSEMKNKTSHKLRRVFPQRSVSLLIHHFYCLPASGIFKIWKSIKAVLPFSRANLNFLFLFLSVSISSVEFI